MKWLILVLLVACGNHTPSAQDVSDSDGDQVPNYLETDSELQKYVAEVVPFSEIKATLAFKNDNKPVMVEFTNHSDLALSAQRLITKSLSTLKLEEHFSEWSRLRLATPDQLIIKESRYSVTLSFNTTERPEFIVLSDEKAEVAIGKFAQRMDFELSGEELSRVLNGKSFFKLQRKEEANDYSSESTVRARTYRVYFYDGRTARIHYVSKELPFERYLKLSGIVESHELKSIKGFAFIDAANVWWTRPLGDEDKVVVHSSLKKLSEFHMKNFIKSDSKVTRSNGVQGQVLDVKKMPNSKFVMKFRGVKQALTFREEKKSWHVGGGRGEINEDCRSWSRIIATNKQISLSKKNLMENLIFQSTDKTMNLLDLSEFVTEAQDEKGPYLELAMDQTPESFKIILPTRPASTYVKTGVYRIECFNRGPSTVNTNEEGQMVINVESFVEKID